MADVMVLCYHAVSATWGAPLSVTPDALERQLGWLTRRGWTGTTMAQAILDPPSRRTLAVTFDDAFASVLHLAHPILAAHGLRASLFVPTSFPSNDQPLSWPGIAHWADTPDAGELKCLDWEQIGLLAQEGWEIGSHTRTHPTLTTLDPDALRIELVESRQDLRDRLGLDCGSIAYPYGDVNQRVADATAEAGYVLGASMSSHLAKLGPLRWPRVGIYRIDGTGRFALKTTRGMRELRASRFWPRDASP